MQGKLRRELGFADLFAVATGTMISSGLFVLPSLAYARCGPGVTWAYLLAALFVLPAMLSKAELATAMPRAGGDYFFIDRSLGPAMGTLGGISAWFSLSFKSAFALVGLGLFSRLVWPDVSYLHIKFIALFFLGVFVLVNISGAKMAGRAQVIMVAALLAVLISFVVAGLPNVRLERYEPLFPGDAGVLFSTAGLVFISYGGLTKVASVAEEVRNPGKTLPLALVSSWLVTTALYGFAVFTTVGLLPPEVMASSSTSSWSVARRALCSNPRVPPSRRSSCSRAQRMNGISI